MESIIDILHKGGYSCVMKNREEVRTFTQRGVADLYDLYQADSAFMKGAAIADKVIGKGAAALMVLGGFKTVYADIISTPALALLCEAGIEYGRGDVSGDSEFYIKNQGKIATACSLSLIT